MNAPHNEDERFADWVDDRLSAEDRELLESELADDHELQIELAEYESAADWVRREGVDERAPAGLVDSIMAAVEAEGAPVTGMRRWLPMLSSVAAAAAMVTIAVFLWTLPDRAPASEESAVLRWGSEKLEDESKVVTRYDRDFAKSGEVRAILENLPEEELVGVSSVDILESARDPASPKEQQPVEPRKDALREGWLEVAKSSANTPAPAAPSATVGVVVADKQDAGGLLNQKKQSVFKESQAAQKALEERASAMRRFERLAGAEGEADAGDKSGKMRKQHARQLLSLAETEQAAEGTKFVEQLARRARQLGFDADGEIDPEVQVDALRQQAEGKAKAVAQDEVGSLVVLVTVPPTPTPTPTPSAEAPGRGRGEQVRARQRGGRRSKSAPVIKIDLAMQLVQPVEKSFDNALPPMVQEVAPVLSQTAHRGLVSPLVNGYLMVEGDRVFSVTGGPSQLATYFSQLRVTVDERGGKIDLLRSPFLHFGLGDEAASSVGLPESIVPINPQDRVVVVVRTQAAQAASPEANAQPKAKAKK